MIIDKDFEFDDSIKPTPYSHYYGFKVICDETNNSPEICANNEVYADIYINNTFPECGFKVGCYETITNPDTIDNNEVYADLYFPEIDIKK